MKSHHIRAILIAIALYMGAICAYAESSLKLRTVTIDAGHGGHDPGSISRDPSKVKEKDLTLDIALKLRDKIRKQHPDVKVVMTRSTDKFVELKERADIANRNKSDLFISIHINSAEVGRGKYWHTANGFSVHCLGPSSSGRDMNTPNMDIVRRENAVIKLEKDYTTSYEGFDPDDPGSYIIFNLMQNANQNQSLYFADLVANQMKKGPLTTNRGISQNAFLVLWRTSMPAVLIECGFIVNKSDLAVLSSPKGRDGIAERICAAFGQFKQNFEGGEVNAAADTAVTQAPVSEEKPEDKPEEAKVNEEEGKTQEESANVQLTDEQISSAKVIYGVQVMASPKVVKPGDPFFKGHKMVAVPFGKLYRYIIVVSTDGIPSKEKLSEVKKQYPGSYQVKVENGEVSRF
ncbi:MAG: N-acetylmuramoyl-L-alanine amidase [Bacteroidales bacterium]|nr:N-acetylmuramoyl-L-alanine amidase [Bacteroidales bacterium]